MSLAAADRRSIAVLVALLLLFGGGTQWWAARRDDAIGHDLQRLAREGDIQMLSSQTCGYCGEARSWLGSRGVRFEECFIERDAACAQRWKALAMPGTPVLLVKGQAQLGFDPERVLRVLDSGRSGGAVFGAMTH